MPYYDFNDNLTYIEDFHDDVSVSTLTLSVRLGNVLKHNNILTLGQLFSLKDTEIKSLKNAGAKCVSEVAALKKLYYIPFELKNPYPTLSKENESILNELRTILNIDDKHYQRLYLLLSCSVHFGESLEDAITSSTLFKHLLCLNIIKKNDNESIESIFNLLSKTLKVSVDTLKMSVNPLEFLSHQTYVADVNTTHNEVSPLLENTNLIYDYPHEQKVKDFKIPTRLYNSLDSDHIVTLGELFGLRNLQNLGNIGGSTVKEVDKLKKSFLRNPLKDINCQIDEEVSPEDLGTLFKVLGISKDENKTLNSFAFLGQNNVNAMSVIASTNIFKYYLLKFLKDKIFVDLVCSASLDMVADKLGVLSAGALNQILSNSYYHNYLHVFGKQVSLLDAKSVICSFFKENNKEKDIVLKRLNGMTLEEVGEQNGNTRERIRQIVVKFSSYYKEKMLFTKEGQYLKLFTQYDWSNQKSHFASIFDLPEHTVDFYENVLLEKIGETSLLDLYYEPTLSASAKGKLLSCLNDVALNIDGLFIKNNRISVLTYFFSHVVKDYRFKSNAEIVEKYTAFISGIQGASFDKLGIKERYISTRTTNSNSNFILTATGASRFYDIDTHNYQTLLEILPLYENVELSTLKILKDFPELKEQLDIQDHYELHKILRILADRYPDKFTNITLTRSPYVTFGQNSIENQALEMLKEYTELSREDFSSLFYDKYGIDPQGFQANYLVKLKEYYTNSTKMYSCVLIAVPQELRSSLEDFTQGEFVGYKDLNAKYQSLLNSLDDSYRSKLPQNIPEKLISELGFNHFAQAQYDGGFCVRKCFNSASAYCNHLFDGKDVVDLTSYPKSIRYGFAGFFNEHLGNLGFIENKPYIYTKFSILGISENDIKDFIECLKTFIEENNIKYFMQSTLLKAGFKHKLNDLFIDNETLFSSLVRYGLDGYIGTIFGTVHSLIFAKRGEVREMIVSNYVKQFVSFNGIAFKDIIKAVKDDCGVQIYNYDLVTYLSKFDEFYVDNEQKRVLIVAK